MKNASLPTVSVCIPSYNCNKFIGHAIESVLNQTFTDFELIIVDDNSKDNTVEVIRKYKDARIRLIENDANIGFEANWNKCLREAKGKYIKLLPQDDLIHPQCIEKQVSIFESLYHKDVVLVCCARNIIDDKNKIVLKRGMGLKEMKVNGLDAIRRVISSGGNLIGEPGAVLFKRNIIATIGEFDGSNLYIIDLDFWCRILLNGSLYYIPEKLSEFRISAGSQSVQMIHSQKKDWIELINKLSADKRYKINQLSATRGKILTTILALGRGMIYFLLGVKPKMR